MNEHTIRPDADAFPRAVCDQSNGDPGMTLRTWMAGQALAGLCAAYYTTADGLATRTVAADAVALADAVIAALQPPPRTEQSGDEDETDGL